MSRLTRVQHQRLNAMGINVWTRRHASGGVDQLRIRLASGDGRWVLVQRQPWRGQFDALLADITATLGVADCRFGQWAKSQEAGVGVSELAERGVQRVLSFGPPPRPLEASEVIEVPTLQAIHDDPEAKRALWRQLQTARLN